MWRYCAATIRAVGQKAAPLSITLLILGGGVHAADIDASDWSKGSTSAARLISSGGLAGDHYAAGIEIKLDGNSLTYWRNPGDAGVPPVFSFAGSQNLGSTTVKYPAPKRFQEGGLDAFGYRENVIFPLDVTPIDRSKPVELALHLQYAACDKICIPAEARVKLRLNPIAPAGPQAARIEAFAERLPKPAGQPGAPLVRIVPQVDKKPSWTLSILPASDSADVFAESPEGWYFDTKAAGKGFTLSLAQKPADAPNSAIEVTLTYVSDAGAYELKQRLDVGPATP